MYLLLKKIYRKVLIVQTKVINILNNLNPKSIYYSLIYTRSILKQPIKCALNSKFKSQIRSKLLINGQLIIGYKYSAICKGKAFVHIQNNSTFQIDGYVTLGKGTTIILRDNASFYMGNNSYIAGDSKVYVTNSIHIGTDCALAWGLTIIDSDFHEFVNSKNAISEPIKIGNHVWVGCNSTILKGVTINDNCVVAANSVVTKDVPPNCLVAGNPAKVIKENISWNL